MKKILDKACDKGIVITIDMEDYSRLERTLEISEDLHRRYSFLSIVLQAYLYRTSEDLNRLASSHSYLRIVKEAYLENSEVAFSDKADVEENYRNLIKLNLIHGNDTAIAAHDISIIQYVQELEKSHGINRSQFEFQMLYGIRLDLQKKLQKSGYKVRVYVPYGTEWFRYNMRRLSERPSAIWSLLKQIVKK